VRNKEVETLLLAKLQVDNVLSLIKGNQYEKCMMYPLSEVKFELERQLRNCNYGKRN